MRSLAPSGTVAPTPRLQVTRCPRGAPGTAAGAGVVLLVIWAVCSALLAFFADDVEGQRVHGTRAVRLLLAFIAFPCIAVGTILISASLRSHPDWRIAKTVLLPISIAGAAAFLLLGSAAGHKHAPGGLYERIFLGLELLWMAIAAWHIAVRPTAEQPG
jgi:Protein of unknown function (DUF998)